MKTAKMILAALMIAVCFNAPVMAQDNKMAKETKLKEHKCTSACKNGKHVYAHGEKGHTCTAACKKTEKKA